MATSLFPRAKAWAWNTIVDKASQQSPLPLRKMPVSITVFVILSLSTAFFTSFFYQLSYLYGPACTEANNCIACSVTIGTVANQKCSSISASALDIRTSCMGFPVPNDYTVVSDIVRSITRMVKNSKTMNATLQKSILAHSEIFDAFPPNSAMQISDPDLTSLKKLLDTHYFGISKYTLPSKFYSRFKSAVGSPLSDSELTSIGLKLLYSYIGIGCALFTDAIIKQTSYNMTKHEYPIYESSYVVPGNPLTQYTTIVVDGYSLQCPSSDLLDLYDANTTPVEERPVGISLGSLDASADWPSKLTPSTKNGLGYVYLGIPNNYVVSTKDLWNNYSYYPDNTAALEFMYYTSFPPTTISSSVGPTGATIFKLDDATGPGVLRHCSLSVFSSTPASLKTPSYKCCGEMTMAQKLSIAYAFAGLFTTVAALATTLLCFCWAPKSSWSENLSDPTTKASTPEDVELTDVFRDIDFKESNNPNGNTRTQHISAANLNVSDIKSAKLRHGPSSTGASS